MTGFDEWHRVKAGSYMSKNWLMKIEKLESGWAIYERTVGTSKWSRIWSGIPTLNGAKAIARNL